jgi:hypothetical protein
MEYDDRIYYYRKDIHIADWLLSFREKLVEEFLARHPDFLNGNFANGESIKHLASPRYESWKLDGIKYSWPERGVECYPGKEYPAEILEIYPTACHIADELGDHCPILQYSVIEPNMHIPRHSGPENTHSKHLRIHVPLIIPEGNIWFECEGHDIDWSDLWAFNNQYTHSAYNRSDTRRLILLVDVSREFLGIAPASPFDEERFQRESKKTYVKHLPSENITLTCNIDEYWNITYTETPYQAQ